MVLGASVQFARPSWKSAFKMSSLKNSRAKIPLVMDSSFSERAFPHSVFDIFGNNQSSVSREIFIQKQLKRRKSWNDAKQNWLQQSWLLVYQNWYMVWQKSQSNKFQDFVFICILFEETDFRLATCSGNIIHMKAMRILHILFCIVEKIFRIWCHVLIMLAN